MNITKYYEDNKKLLSITIELTKKCSFFCKHCYNGIPESREIPFERLKEFLIIAKSKGVYEIILTGGDVFLYTTFRDLVILIRNLGFQIVLLSNLFSCNYDDLLFLKRLNIRRIEFTIFSMDEKMNDLMTNRKYSLKTIKNNIDICKKLGIELLAKNEIVSLDPNSYMEFEKYCKELKIQYTSDYVILDTLEGKEKTKKYMCNPDELKKIIKKTIKYEDLLLGSYDNEDYVCSDSLCSEYIDSLGNVYPCFFISFRYICKWMINNSYKSQK